MEPMTMLLMPLLALTSPALGYSYLGGRGGGAPDLGDYLGGAGGYEDGVAGDELYGIPDYQQATHPRYTYARLRPRINKEAMAALLSAAIDDYMDYDTYSDTEGTWYDDYAAGAAPQEALQQQQQQQQLQLQPQQPITSRTDPSLMQLLFNPRPASSGPVRYSLEDLENLERTAAREENTEDQLQALTHRTLTKKSLMPLLGGHRIAVTPMLLKKGQKEEMFEVPATSVRRPPVFARSISTYPDQPATRPLNYSPDTESQEEAHQTPAQTITNSQDSQTNSQNSQNSQQKSQSSTQDSLSSSQSSRGSSKAVSPVSSSSEEEKKEKPSVGVPLAAETPYLKASYDTLRSFLDRERKARQERDQKQRVERRAPRKRFITEQESLTQQLASLKKTVA